jgi:hypothetical protein
LNNVGFWSFELADAVYLAAPLTAPVETVQAVKTKVFLRHANTGEELDFESMKLIKRFFDSSRSHRELRVRLVEI